MRNDVDGRVAIRSASGDVQVIAIAWLEAIIELIVHPVPRIGQAGCYPRIIILGARSLRSRTGELATGDLARQIVVELVRTGIAVLAEGDIGWGSC